MTETRGKGEACYSVGRVQGWAKVIAKHLTVHRTAPCTKNFLDQNVHSAEVEKSCHRKIKNNKINEMK